MEKSLKTGFAQIFSCWPKNLSCPNFGGAAAPLAPPGPYAYVNKDKVNDGRLKTTTKAPDFRSRGLQPQAYHDTFPSFFFKNIKWK